MHFRPFAGPAPIGPRPMGEIWKHAQPGWRPGPDLPSWSLSPTCQRSAVTSVVVAACLVVSCMALRPGRGYGEPRPVLNFFSACVPYIYSLL